MMDAAGENAEANAGDVQVLVKANEESSSVEDINTVEKELVKSGDIPAQYESDDDVRKLFVGGLNWGTTDDDLQTYFSQWGNVTQCIIKVDRFTGNSRGFGFVTFQNEDSVNKVLNVSEHKLMGKRIDPKRAKPSREVIKKIFVGGIDPELPEECIKEYFSQFGQVESLDLPFDTLKKKRKHYIFVSFATEAAARKAIAKDRQEIHGRQCDVRVAVAKDQANKNKNMKCLGYIDPTYAYAPYPYGDYSNAYASLDPYTYGGYYGCYDYFNPSANPNATTSGYGMYTNYAMNSALFHNQYGANRSNNSHHAHHNAAAGANPHYPNSATAVTAAVPGGAGGATTAMSYPATAAANSSSHWNSTDSAQSVSTFSDYAATASHPQ